MTSYYFFQKDDLIQIVNPLSPFYRELAKILDVQNNYYFVRLQDRIMIRVNIEDISPWFKDKDEEVLYQAQLFQLQLLAVDTNDREWFHQIGNIINKLKEHKTLNTQPLLLPR